ncbi:MAG: 2,3-bisphosphoglycerate-independent phosphoglycerate mutase [Filifactoraceae bacterium]
MKKIVALIILDGFGCSSTILGNAVENANTPNLDRYCEIYPHTLIEASGEAVGLPDGQMGNSEVGHLNIGSGRVVYQELTRISKEIREGDFFKNQTIVELFQNTRKNDKTLHLMGLLSDGGVHSHINHLKALINMSQEHRLNSVKIHVFLDGRDTAPNSGINYINELEIYIKGMDNVEIATVSGRYYAMDRDNRWERVKKAFDGISLGKGSVFNRASDYIEASYERNLTDEFIETGVVKNYSGINEHDSILFYNFRPDRAREITRAFVDEKFDFFEREYKKLNFVTMTQYDSTIQNVKVAYLPATLENTLGEYVSKKGLTQLRIAETEKYAHVTFFFNGGREEKYENEFRILIDSPKVSTYDLQPEMSAYLVTDALIKDLDSNPKNLIILNFANPDMVGHTGNYEAAVKAIETVDECLGKIVEKILSMGGTIVISADHGNSEKMIGDNGKPHTAHTTNKVPLILIDNEYINIELMEEGKLCDFAPTLLDLLNISTPREMTGHSLIKK